MAEQFTVEQQAIIAATHAEAMRVGTCTEHADRKTTEECIAQMYALVGKKCPPFFWFDGPMSACRAIGKREPKYAKTIAPYFAGGENSYWVYHYIGGAKVGSKYSQIDQLQLAIWERLCGASGWWFPFENAVVCADRHKTIRLDDRRLIHCEDGPAIECRDGYKLYAWHGTRIPAEWIESRATLKPEVALTWQNIEQRRCAAEIIGWAQVIAGLKHKVIDRDADPLIGTLLEVNIPDSGKQKFLLVRCPTGRDFALVADNSARTALEANAASYGLTGDMLRVEARG
jgi:hypothetical protein